MSFVAYCRADPQSLSPQISAHLAQCGFLIPQIAPRRYAAARAEGAGEGVQVSVPGEPLQELPVGAVEEPHGGDPISYTHASMGGYGGGTPSAGTGGC